jgi:hypothetical protein
VSALDDDGSEGDAALLGSRVGDATPLEAGDRARILEVSSEDAYYDDRDEHVGVTCTVGSMVSAKGGGWYDGDFNDCTNGEEYYYFKVRAEKVGGGGEPAAPAAPSADDGADTVVSGDRVRLLEVSSEDAYYENRDKYEGVVCTAGDSITNNGGGWYGGPFSCVNGKEPYFYKVRAKKIGDGSG